jgi:hypothetical protein
LHTLAYTLYGLVVFVVLLYVMFPYDLLRQRVVERFLRDDLRLAIASLRPEFPPGVQLRQVRLLTTSAASTETLAHVETLRIQPDVLALLSTKLDFRLDARLYNGRFEGNMRTAVADGESSWELQARFSDVQLEQHPLAQKDTKAFLRGRLEGDVTATLDSAGLLNRVVNLRMQPLVFMGTKDCCSYHETSPAIHYRANSASAPGSSRLSRSIAVGKTCRSRPAAACNGINPWGRVLWSCIYRCVLKRRLNKKSISSVRSYVGVLTAAACCHSASAARCSSHVLAPDRAAMRER